jgi:hypothetical protein
MEKVRKQQIINEVTSFFSNKQWFNGAGFSDAMEPDKLIVAYNYYPAFELVEVKTALMKWPVQYELKDIRVLMPGSQKDDVPPYVRQ